MELGTALDEGAAVWILGQLRFATPAGHADGDTLRGQQPQVVLAHLAAVAAPLSPGDLATAVWSERRPSSWATTLRSVVSRLRHDLLTAGWPATDPIPYRPNGYTLHADGPLWVDASYVRHAVTTAETALAAGDVTRAAAMGEAAWQLARRPPVLPPGTSAGAHLARRMRATAHRAAAVAASAWLAAEDPDFAAHFARGAVEVAPYRETGWRLLLEAHGQRRDRSAAAATFDEMLTVFETELGVSPHADTFALYRRVVGAERGGRRTVPSAGL